MFSPISQAGAKKRRVDWMFLSAIAGLVCIGSIMILSSASPLPHFPAILHRHFLALGLGTSLFLVGHGLNYQVYQDQARAIYAFAIALLVAVLVVGVTQRGHKAWFHLGFVTFQPSELARICLILALANEIDRRQRRIEDLPTVLCVLAFAVPVMALILKQPDLTTVMTFFPLVAAMLFCAGANLIHLLALLGFNAVAIAVPMFIIFLQVHFPDAPPGSLSALALQALSFGPGLAVLIACTATACYLAWRLAVMTHSQPNPVVFSVVAVILSTGIFCGSLANRELKGYQRSRISSYFAPESDIQGTAYHVQQSQVAIGSGGIWGKGLFSGTQAQLGFLPERHTDFIFSVVGEELGFFGGIGVLSLYLLLIWRIVAAACLARDYFGFLVCCGIACLLSSSLILNVGMCLGLLPVAGMPLPLVSYGGSSLMITLWALGIVGNVYARRYSLL
jgi:rod shape determining protein RodA